MTAFEIQEGLFIVIVIIILYLPAFEALAVSCSSLVVQLVQGQVKLLMSLRMLSSHFET